MIAGTFVKFCSARLLDSLHMQFGADLHVFNSLEEGVVAVDSGSTVVFFNMAAERMFGWRSDEVVGHPLDRLIPVASRGVHHRHIEQFRAAGTGSRMMGERSSIQALRRDGSVFDAEASITHSAIGGSVLLIAIIRDVTARRAAEARLLASEQKHRAILEACGDAVLIADADTGRIDEANAAAGSLFGCRPDDLIGLHQSELHPEADREHIRRVFREHVEAGRILVPEASILRRDGSVVPVEIAARPTLIDGTLKVVGFFRDVTHRVEHERALVEAREAALAANRSKTTFLANISHELRTPLNAIIGLSEMIGEEIFGPVGHPKYREYSGDIRDSGRHLLDVINDILDLSRVEMGKFALRDEDLDVAVLAEQCRRTVRTLADDSGLICEILIEPAAGRLRADRRAVRQMLLNLLSNAIRHTPRGGRIKISSQLTGDGGLALAVSDTGAGIPPERLASVTVPFNSSAEKMLSAHGGTGLGLAITKGLLEHHGGALEIASRPGRGTSVRLVFPAGRVPA